MTTLIVSHDAGGAEILSSWIKNKRFKQKMSYFLEGPAIDIFKKKIKNIEIINKKQLKSLKVNRILTGTSWESDIEKKMVLYGRKNKITTCSFLDHWNNYNQRFTLNKKINLPNIIYVSDKYAFKIAKNKFKNTQIRLTKNHYKSEFLNKIKPRKKHVVKTILYVSEPIRKHALKQHNDAMFWGYDEFSSLDYFFTCGKSFLQKNVKIIFRKHPSEKLSKYSNVLKRYSDNHKIVISNNKDLYKDINRSDIVVGNQSMAMVIALYAGRKALSILPNFAPRVLPHKKIIYLNK